MAPSLSATAASRGRILVVDDNRDARDSLALVLRTMGYAVQTAGDGESALTTALEFKPQLALLDVVMPGASGFRTAERLRQLEGLRDIIIVTVTAWQEEVDDFLSKNAGADYHLLKPIDMAALQKILEEHLPE